jgi:hypothetical protein
MKKSSVQVDFFMWLQCHCYKFVHDVIFRHWDTILWAFFHFCFVLLIKFLLALNDFVSLITWHCSTIQLLDHLSSEPLVFMDHSNSRHILDIQKLVELGIRISNVYVCDCIFSDQQLMWWLKETLNLTISKTKTRKQTVILSQIEENEK